ncbi:hypothetical protein [Cyanobium sp. CH-040]|uniref:hypothetical protein n=1 Tax=Cyanobium sp. CH-040 TaxID=2823708 RepID=UPI0020CD5F3E|nr:hypothetical protein [Cyanobium sp. CH-040]MCP9928910.1 hypothetical protein [Cyanobium sp. CH-040]
MARFLLVLKPTGTQPAATPGERGGGLLECLAPVLDALHADVDHRTPAHLGALLRNGAENQRMQLFADVQSHADGRLLELVLLSREPMGTRAPDTSRTFQRLVDLVHTHLPNLAVVFRSDRDGPAPPPRPAPGQ